jgi:hypothetical protein
MTIRFHEVSNQIRFDNNVDIPIEKNADANQNRSNIMERLSLFSDANISEALPFY